MTSMVGHHCRRNFGERVIITGVTIVLICALIRADLCLNPRKQGFIGAGEHGGDIQVEPVYREHIRLLINLSLVDEERWRAIKFIGGRSIITVSSFVTKTADYVDFNVHMFAKTDAFARRKQLFATIF